jgi:hypothetical protein
MSLKEICVNLGFGLFFVIHRFQRGRSFCHKRRVSKLNNNKTTTAAAATTTTTAPTTTAPTTAATTTTTTITLTIVTSTAKATARATAIATTTATSMCVIAMPLKLADEHNLKKLNRKKMAYH